MAKKFKHDLTGIRYGRLVVENFVPDQSNMSKWECLCDCGVRSTVFASSLTRGLTRSCGCLLAESSGNRMRKHGHAANKNHSGTYSSWRNMMNRCEWLKCPERIFYHDKGIRVHERWHDFENFLADMGQRPKKMSIDRIDNSRGYEPGNCRWATQKEQNLNTSRTVRVLIDGKTVIVYNLCEELGISRKALRSRAVRRGYDYAKALQSFGIVCENIPLSE